jgi:hypothetical protein
MNSNFSSFAEECCALAVESDVNTHLLDSTYEPHLDLLERLRIPLSLALNVSSNMSFYELVKYTDTIFARKFEGLEYYSQFTDGQMHDIFEVNKWAQTKKVSDEGK